MSGIHREVTHRPASTEEDGVWAWVFRECEDCDLVLKDLKNVESVVIGVNSFEKSRHSVVESE